MYQIFNDIVLFIEVLCMDRMTGHRVGVPCTYRTGKGRLQLKDLDRAVKRKISQKYPDLFALEPCEILSMSEFKRNHPAAFELYCYDGVREGLTVYLF